MKKLLLMTAILTTAGITSNLNAVGKNYTHYCVCDHNEAVSCETACKKSGGVWSGDATLSNTKKLKGIKCDCVTKDLKKTLEPQVIRCDGGITERICGIRKGAWKQKIGVTNTGEDRTIDIDEDDTKLELLERTDVK